ncbi:cbb3-type cytochrome oxidase assembly protein CcoS [Novosphingobium sp. FKTRR1]|uniref:cbb3-type cytochrome oxidase assembly protein CcoS n=1 Tax=unclassified Novosphingobium TaxID=2644732 RepID=UPI001CF0BAEC|nr:cbb3-type cytochrome oxidase assembly protein CcoS [Novosphingobium sp. FKTRR1]
MTSIAILLPIALGMGLCGLATFFWALRHGQFSDLDGAAARILIDEDDVPDVKP